jgi:predicted  nucleic acid-binding Zn-ribbon protein
MDSLDAAKSRLRDVEKDMAGKAQAIEMEKNEFKDLAARLQAEIARLKETRKPQATAVESDLLGQYERLLKRQGVPLVKVENEICGNCHLKLTPQTANQARKGKHVSCENCGHLLYADD